MPTFITDKAILDTFWRDDREGQFDVAFDVRGRVRETIHAGTLAEARALADEMAQGEEMELYGPDFDDVRIDYVRPCPPMYLVLRDGKEWGVSHVQPGDVPREPNSEYEASKYTVRPVAAEAVQ